MSDGMDSTDTLTMNTTPPREMPPTLLREGSRPRPTDILVAVMGMTGAGKSSFISLCTGRDDAIIGHGLEACQ